MEFLPKLVESGVVTTILAISIALNYYLIKLLLQSFRERIDEAKKYSDKLAGTITKFSNTLAKLEKKVVTSKKKPRGDENG